MRSVIYLAGPITGVADYCFYTGRKTYALENGGSYDEI